MKQRLLVIATIAAALALPACGEAPATTTVPASTVPESTVPGGTGATTTIPVTTIPVTTIPVTTIPVATVPATTVPTTGGDLLVAGYVHAGPVCPVMQNPPDPECDDRPVPDAVLLVLDGGGAPVTEARTDAAGRFEVLLPAGDYTLVPQPVEGLLGTASPLAFTVSAGEAPDLDIAYDTGIR